MTSGELGYASEFGEALKRRRLARGISQSRLAHLAGFDHSYVSRIEAGDRNPTYSAILAMALALGCTVSERDVLLMFGGFLPPGWREIDTDLLRLHAAINDRTLPEDDRANLRDVVRALVLLAESRAPVVTRLEAA